MRNDSFYKTIEDAIRIERKKQKNNNNIYHYTSIRALLGIIEKGELWLSRVNSMNDKSEQLVFIEQLFEDAKDRAIQDNHYKYDAVKKMVESTLGIKMPYAMCFSKSDNDAAQWERYADNGCGVCIEFNKEKIQTIIKDNFSLRDITYGVDNSSNDYNDLLTIIKDYAENRRLSRCFDDSNHFIFSILDFAANYKHESFKPENEVRIITIPWYNIKKMICEYELVNNVVKEVVKIKIGNGERYNIQNNLIEKIVIGPRSKQTVEDLKGFLESKNLNHLAEVVSKTNCPLI